MPLSRQLYQECSKVLSGSTTVQRVVTRGAEMAFQPIVWESILLTIHFLCVVHAVQQERPFERLAERWHSWRDQRKRPPDDLKLLRAETDKALQALENDLRNMVIKPLESQIEAAHKRVHQILEEHTGTRRLPPETASRIVSTVAQTLKEHGPDTDRLRDQ